MEVILERVNPLLKRKEVVVELVAESNPGFAIVLKEISGKFKADEGSIAVLKVDGNFGRNKFRVEAHIYDSEELKNKTEPKKKEKK